MIRINEWLEIQLIDDMSYTLVFDEKAHTLKEAQKAYESFVVEQLSEHFKVVDDKEKPDGSNA